MLYVLILKQFNDMLDKKIVSWFSKQIYSIKIFLFLERSFVSKLTKLLLQNYYYRKIQMSKSLKCVRAS